MIEFVLEILIGGLLEFVGEAIIELPWDRDEDKVDRSRDARRRRFILAIKLVVGLVAGAAWGYYVNRTTGGSWPRSFWSFAVLAAIFGVLATAGFSTERFAEKLRSGALRKMLTFTPRRFTEMTFLSLTAALGIVIGFFLGG